MPSCRQCRSAFEITKGDLALLDKLSPIFNGKKEPIPPPTLCPGCRQQRRIAWRNERSLHHRSCQKCGKVVVSVYAPGLGIAVLCPECWWGDGWDPLSWGKDFDDSRPFFEQVGDLLRSVPLLSNNVLNSVNAEFNSFCVDAKDAYLSARVADSEHVYYCYLPLFSLQCVDCYAVDHCQYCYECVNCWNCYNALFCQLCRDCSDVSFCHACIGCKECTGCTNLRNASFCFFNEQLTQEEYRRRVAGLSLSSASALHSVRARFEETRLRSPMRAVVILNGENATGDFITNARDVAESYDVDQSESVRYSWGVEYSRDIGDSDFIYYGERCYENLSNAHSTNIFFSFAALQAAHDLWYSLLCVNGAHDCFGCVSLQRKQYCILNKQYTKDEYERLVPRIIERMRKTPLRLPDGSFAGCEWGEFFPITMSPFGYNETVAQEYFPLTKEEALRRGWRWRDRVDEMPKVSRVIPAEKLPDAIDDIPDDILQWAIECEVTGRPFRLIRQELEFYRRMKLPVPRLHPDERHRRRMALRNPRKLWDRQCAKCKKQIATSFSPERPEIVYCESCYLKEVS